GGVHGATRPGRRARPKRESVGMSPASQPASFQLAVRAVDRRRHPRVPVLYHLVMQVAESKRIVSMEDISLSGVAVFSADPPETGTAVVLGFPKQASKSGVMVGVSGRIVRQAGPGIAGIVFD